MRNYIVKISVVVLLFLFNYSCAPQTNINNVNNKVQWSGWYDYKTVQDWKDFYIEYSDNLDPIEGIWMINLESYYMSDGGKVNPASWDNVWKIAIYAIQDENYDYVGVVLENNSIDYESNIRHGRFNYGDNKLWITKTADENIFNVDWAEWKSDNGHAYYNITLHSASKCIGHREWNDSKNARLYQDVEWVKTFPLNTANPKNEWLNLGDWKSVVEFKQMFDEGITDNFEGIWNVNLHSYELDGNGQKMGVIDYQNIYEIVIAEIDDELEVKYDFMGLVLDHQSSIEDWNYGDMILLGEKTATPGIYSIDWYDFKNPELESKINLFMTEGNFIEGKRDWITNDGVKIYQDMYFLKKYPINSSQTIIEEKSTQTSSSGSGFLITLDGHIVTNYHVIDGCSEIVVEFPYQNKNFNANLRLKDKINDIAILELSDFDNSLLNIYSIPYDIAGIQDVKVGQEIFTLGFPLGEIMGSSPRLSPGRINSLSGIEDDPRLYQINNPIQPGNSGGPVINDRGQLVGIVVSRLNAELFYEELGIIPQNINFAIKGSFLENLLVLLPPESTSKSIYTKLNSNKNMEGLVEDLTPVITQIKCGN